MQLWNITMIPMVHGGNQVAEASTITPPAGRQLRCEEMMLVTLGILIIYNIYIYIYIYCEQIDPCSGLSLLSVVPVMLISPGNLSAWHADSVIIFLAQDLSQYHWRSMHDCTHVHHVQLHCYLVPLRSIYIYVYMYIDISPHILAYHGISSHIIAYHRISSHIYFSL